MLKFASNNPTRMVDDAFIYLRFANNLAQGFGFSWNPGEAPVEGFTSITYLMLLVLSEKLNISSIGIIPFLGIGSSLVLLILSWQLGEFINPAHNSENLLALILVGLSPIFLFWSPAGLEMPLYTALLMASALSYLAFKRRKVPAWLVGCIFAITTLTRPESLMLFCITIIFDSLTKIIGKKRLIDQDILHIFTGYLVVCAPVYVCKWVYFGQLFPNTYYAKTGGGLVQVLGGAAYLAKSFYYVFAGIGIPLFLLLIRFNKIKWTFSLWLERSYLAVLIVCSWGIVVLNGGDHFVLGRFIMPTIPFLFFLIITVAYSNLFDNQDNVERIKPIFIMAPLLIAVIFWKPWSYISMIDLDTTGFIKIGETLNEIASEDESIAVIPIGAIGYYSKMNVIDMLGLVDPVIAHELFEPHYIATWRPGHDKGNGKYILSKQPDYILLVDRLTSQPQPVPDEEAMHFKSVVEIWASPDFHTLYNYRPVQTKSGLYINLYQSADSLEYQEAP